jgi:hypothetical protein
MCAEASKGNVLQFKMPLWAELDRFLVPEAWKDVHQTLREITNKTGLDFITVLKAFIEQYGERAEHELHRQSDAALAPKEGE